MSALKDFFVNELGFTSHFPCMANDKRLLKELGGDDEEHVEILKKKIRESEYLIPDSIKSANWLYIGSYLEDLGFEFALGMLIRISTDL